MQEAEAIVKDSTVDNAELEAVIDDKRAQEHKDQDFKGLKLHASDYDKAQNDTRLEDITKRASLAVDYAEATMASVLRIEKSRHAQRRMAVFDLRSTLNVVSKTVLAKKAEMGRSPEAIFLLKTEFVYLFK